MCAPHLDWERRTGYYKNRYQQSSQEQMVRRSYAQTDSSCQYRTDGEKTENVQTRVQTRSWTCKSLDDENDVKACVSVTVTHGALHFLSALWFSFLSFSILCYCNNPSTPLANSLHLPRRLSLLYHLKCHDNALEYKQTLMPAWYPGLLFDPVSDSSSQQMYLCFAG